jgi:D-alanyl-D-alanine carboxypeptidase/D-alanyl-D-alanine-endopeptidase (penicillin-binding protein 4)
VEFCTFESSWLLLKQPLKYLFHVQAIKYAFPKVAVLALMVFFACASPGSLKKPEKHPDAILNLRQGLERILQDSLLQQTRTGIEIVSLESGETLYAQNNHQLFHPASNMKLLTTAAALKQLGPDFKFKTALYADTSSVSGSVITGNLYLKGFGNPDLSSEDLRSMVQKLTSRGISAISGNLICDDTYMDDLYWGSGWMWDDVSAWYWAPICALSVNDNCVEVIVKPGSRVGDSLVVQLEPPTRYMKIVNMGVTIDSLDTLQQKPFKVERKWKPAENTIVVEGGMAIGDSERTFVIDVIDAALYAATLFSELLRQEDINFKGQVLKNSVPDTTIVLAEHFSPPLTMAVINTNKISDNLSAELLLKTLGAEIKGPPGTAKKGISVIHQFLDKIGIDSTTYELADGSGVSRYNVITPALIIELLTAMHKDFQIQAEFKTSLPIAGIDGTLKSRMRNSAAESKLRAKTGSLRGVSALSGYTTTTDNELLAFSIIMEHFVVQTSKIRKIQDRIGDLISSFSRNLEK